jgi:hypothetical protein
MTFEPETATTTTSPSLRNIASAFSEAQRMIDLISTPEKEISDQDRRCGETTYRNFANRNKGF